MLAMITTQTVISKSSANMATAAHTVQVLPTIDLKLIAHHPPGYEQSSKILRPFWKSGFDMRQMRNTLPAWQDR
jgi:hypothetical protein